MSLIREMINPMVRALAGRTVGLLEAFSRELEMERNRLICTIAWTCAAICSCSLAIGLACLLAAFVLPLRARVELLAACAVGFAALGILLGLAIRRRLRNEPIRLPLLSGILAVGQILNSALDREDSG
ncbi:MAG TPA: hypothetical protein VHC86_12845 [Opitutaceae bacterium]|nr:hypothetical protein [Opitutaceae bacterium]